MKSKSADIPVALLVAAAAVMMLFGTAVRASAEEPVRTLELQPLIDEALTNNHDVLVAGAKRQAADARIRQAGSLPDPMVMVGYQNEGWRQYTYGQSVDAQWMFSVSQMFPFPGKRAIREQMASRDADTAGAMQSAARLATEQRVKELYYDLFQVHKDLDLIRERTSLFSRIEEAALARYASGTGPQQEVLMAQTEKYMLLERETMLNQKRRSLEAMLIAAVGRQYSAPLGRPAEPAATPFAVEVEELVRQALERSPEVLSRQKMAGASTAGVHMAQKEFYPDVTVTGSVFTRPGEYQDMWSLTATFNIPLYYNARQSQALAEARAMSLSAEHDLEGVRSMVASAVRDNYAMIRSADALMNLYREGLLPKTVQDFELSLAGYRSGKVEEITALSRLKALVDYELAYWAQFVEREKAIARIEALTGGGNPPAAQGEQHEHQEQK